MKTQTKRPQINKPPEKKVCYNTEDVINNERE